MIEMFNVNLLNETPTTAPRNISNIFDNKLLLSRNYNNFSGIRYDDSTLSSSSSASASTNVSQQMIEEPTALLTDLIMNTTAIVVHYATQWLTSTIATTAANMSAINEQAIATVASAIITNTTEAAATIEPTGALDTSAFYAAATATLTTTLTTMPNLSDGVGSSFVDTFSERSMHYDYNNSVNKDDNECPNLMDLDDGETLNDCHPQNPNFNCTIEDYLQFTLGPKTLPIHKALLITIIYGGIFITGILGNILICVVIVRHKAMHTATNYYLFSLAVSDLIFLIFGLPTEIVLYWHQYPYLFGLPFCKVRAYISEACSYVSVFTIVAFSVERYLAICHPLHLYAMSGFKRALRIIALLWVISFLGALPFGLLTKIEYLNFPKENIQIDDSAFCVMFPDTELYVFEISFVVFFLIPMLLIIFFYGRMGQKIRSSTSKELGIQPGSMRKESHHQQSRKAVIRMLAAVVLTFFICWLPFHAQRLFYVYGKCYKYYIEVNEVLFSITGFAYYVSCTVNPILYNVMSHRYRVAFKDTLCGRRRSVNQHNGFARDQSSFRENTVASSCGNTGIYDRSSYARSFRISNNIKDRASIKSNNVTWKKTDFCTPLVKEIPENHTVVNSLTSGTNVVVCVENGVNGRTKVFTENEAQATLLNKNDETCI